MNWDDGLVGTVLNIAKVDHSPLRVVAGPGTGKTFALMRRVARLLQSGEDPATIFLCSFTRTAAADLAKAIKDLGVAGVDKVKTATLHAHCFEVLAKEDVLTNTGRVPRPLLEMEERFFIEDIKGGDFGGVRECRKRLVAFNSAWARLQHEAPGWCSDKTDKAFNAALLGWLKFHRGMLIGEVVPEMLRYLRTNPASPHRGSFKHVLVDEYQDLNKAEQDLLGLVAEMAKYSVIGDDDQAIYAFKHAHPEGIIEFPTRYVGTHNEELNECRRCPTRVVEMANNLIANNTVRSSRSLTPRAGNPDGEVYLVQWLSMNDEAKGVTRFIRKKIDDGLVTPGEILVLAPRRLFGYAIRDELARAGTPVNSFFTEEVFDGDVTNKKECECAEAYTLLSLLANPEDRTSMRVWCGLGHAELRSTAWAALRTHCESAGISPRQSLEAMRVGTLTLPLNKPQAKALTDRYEELRAREAALLGTQGPALFDAVFPTALAAAEPLRELAVKVGAAWGPKQIFEMVSGFISQPELPTDADYVRVMSLHKSKGLTAKCVVVTGCIEGALPRVDGGQAEDIQRRAIEEQRRLMYVAVTRTTNILLLSSVLTLPRKFVLSMGITAMSGKGPDVTTQTSRFWAEFGPAAPTPILGNTLPP